MKSVVNRLSALHGWMTRHRVILGGLLSLFFAALLGIYNVSSGPLKNLNDIGGWENRALFIAMTAAVHVLLLFACTMLSRCCFERVALRQMIVTAGFYIMLLAINQKTYAFVEVMLPAVRAMQSGGFAAGLALNTGLSAFALLILRILSATPIYPMYMMKLLAMASMLIIALLMMRAAERSGLGIRTEALLALCVILPQGFMNAAASALIDVTAIALLMGALTLAYSNKIGTYMASTALYGCACALSGVCLYALPVFVLAAYRNGNLKRMLPVAAGLLAATALPASLGGVPIGKTLASYLYAIFGTPAYAAGSPGVFSLIPRALVTEIPQYAATLRHLPSLDLVTNAQLFYTQEHFVIVMRGLTLVGLAAYAGVCMLVCFSDKPALHRVMTLVLTALMICPGATSGAWLLCDVLCLYAIVAAPKLRVPACLALFATMCSASYPMTEEVLLPMVYAFALTFIALLMLLGVVPMGREESIHE